MRFFILISAFALALVGCGPGGSSKPSKVYTIHNNAEEGGWLTPTKGEAVYFSIKGKKRQRLEYNQCVSIAGDVFSQLTVVAGQGGWVEVGKTNTLCGGEGNPCKPGNYVILNKPIKSVGSGTLVDKYVMESSNKMEGKCAHSLHGAEVVEEKAEEEESA